MGWSFRKSLKIGPIRLNISKSGLGYSIGGKGIRVGRNAKGKAYSSLSIPGTGIRHTSIARSRRAIDDIDDGYEGNDDLKPQSTGGSFFYAILRLIKLVVVIVLLTVAISVVAIIWNSLRGPSTPNAIQPTTGTESKSKPSEPRAISAANVVAQVVAPHAPLPESSTLIAAPPSATNDTVDTPKPHATAPRPTKSAEHQSELSDAGKKAVMKSLLNARDWHLNDGRTVHGVLKSFGAGIVRLTAPNGETLRLREDELTAADLRFIISNLK